MGIASYRTARNLLSMVWRVRRWRSGWLWVGRRLEKRQPALRTAILAAFSPISLTAVLAIASAEPGMVDTSSFGLLINPIIYSPVVAAGQAAKLSITRK